MRKIYKMAGLACLGLMLSTTNINAQTVSDFESLTLPTNSFWDGSDLSGTHNAGIFSSSFASGEAIFINQYDTSFGLPGYWAGGFAYSSITDSTTSGSGNIGGSRAGQGVNNSDNYIIAKNNSTIELTGTSANNTVSGVYITNTTYAANSMRDGDTFGKKFGGSTGNDPDFFKLTIFGYTGGALTTDSVEFYLADYRFADTLQDYIVTTWEWVDLSSLGAIDSLTFILSSSDTGSFGINTPTFFALDNFNDQTVTSIDENVANSINISVYPNPTEDQISISTDMNINSLNVLDITGKIVLSENNLRAGINNLDLSALKKGVYFIQAITKDSTTTERLIKK